MPHARLLAVLLALAPGVLADEWVEVRSPHFRVLSNAGEKRARDAAAELERIRLVFRSALVNLQQDPGLPIVAFAVRNEEGLRELLPEYWEREGPKPAGVFQRATDKHYVVVRVDVRPEQRYPLIYHEYFHLLLGLNVQRVPVWLNEGLASFWDQTRVRGNRVDMGTPDEGYLHLLQSRRMMPLGELLAMERNPHVTDPDRVGIFYAQSWALTHLLMLGDKEGESARALGGYVSLVEEGADPLEAFVSVFGEVGAMEERLERYVRQKKMFGLVMEAPEKIDKDSFPTTELTEAKAAAARGSFLVSGARPDAALPLLERALALAPDDTVALESMGFYHFRKNEREEAREWFSKAVGVDSDSYLCHYYLAQLTHDDDEAVKERLRRTIELNPKFAPAYAELGRLYVATGVRLESAYGAAFKAVELEPDNAWHWINLGQILLRMEKLAEARAVAGRAIGVARSEGLRVMAERFRRDIESHETRRTTAIDHPDALAGRKPWGNDRRIEGRFKELRCKEGAFDFVVESDGEVFVFRTTAPETIQLIEKGESVIRDMNCGPQDAPVGVIYTPSEGEAAADAHGELRVLEFLP